MQQQTFILSAYLLTAALVSLLCLTTFIRARKVSRLLREAQNDQAARET